MSDQGSKDKRPESFDDLPEWVRLSTILRLDLNDDGVFESSVAQTARSFIASLREQYGDRLIVLVEGGRLSVDLLATEDALARALERHQKRWDEQHPGQAPSTEAGA